MALLKKEYNGFSVKTGDGDIDTNMEEQLKISPEELVSAINAENLTDQIFTRLLRLREKSHKALIERLSGK